MKYWESIWNSYEKNPKTLETLKGIFMLLSNPDWKSNHFLTEEQSLHSDAKSLREIVSAAVKFVKSKLVEDTTIRTIVKGVIAGDHTKQESDSTFDVELTDSNLKQISFTRKRISSSKPAALAKTESGAIVRWINKKNSFGGKPNIYQSIKAAIMDGSFEHDPLHIHIKQHHYRYPVFQYKQNFNIMLVLDISNSVKWVLKFMDKIISVLTAQARASKDKLGLIIFNDDRAKIMHYPTTNLKHVIGTINTLSPKGKTPLADGLKMALQTLEHSRFQVTGMANAIVLLSDCFPEPITGEYADQLDEPVCQQLLHVCDRIAESKIKLLVLTPSIKGVRNNKKYLGYRLSEKAAERAKGRFLNLEANPLVSPYSEQCDYEFSASMVKTFAAEVSNFRMS